MTTRGRRLAIFLAVALLCTAAASAAGASELRHASHAFHWRGGVDKLAIADLDGDGLDDLLIARRGELDIHMQDAAAGFRLAAPDATLRIPGASAGWDLERAPGAGAWRLTAVIDGRELRAWSWDAGARSFAEAQSAVAGLQAVLPRGVWHLDFLHDIDGDGDEDLVLPGAGVFQTFLRGSDGTFAKGPSAVAELALESRVAGDGDLRGRIGRSAHLPLLDLRDVNGDQRRDLISKTSDRLEVYLAGEEGRLPDRPSMALDIGARRERLGRFDPGELDLSNLTGVLAYTLETQFQDADGDGITDLLLREGGKVSIFLGTARGIEFEKPDQVLKSAGNVLSAFLFDEDGDGRKDLWIARIEEVSAGEVVLWLVASGSLEFEAFVYRAEGRTFARRPSRKLTLKVRFPSVPSMMEMSEQLTEEMKEQERTLTEAADLARVGRRGDLLALRGDTLRGYLGLGEEPSSGAGDNPLLDAIDYRRDRDEYELDLQSFVDRVLRGGNESVKWIDDKPADFTIDMPGAGNAKRLHVGDFNRDGIDDALILLRNDAEALTGAFVLSKRAP